MRPLSLPRTRLDRAARRAQIIEASASVFKGRDPSEVTFEEIAESAGVSRALVYNYFGDRRGLLEAIHDRHYGSLQRQIEAALVSTRGRRQAFEAVIQVHLNFAQNDASAYRAAIGLHVLPHDPQLSEARIRDLAKMFGGSPRAMIMGTGVLHAMWAMVLRAVERKEVPIEEAAIVITASLWSGLLALDELGLTLTPFWEIPQPA